MHGEERDEQDAGEEGGDRHPDLGGGRDQHPAGPAVAPRGERARGHGDDDGDEHGGGLDIESTPGEGTQIAKKPPTMPPAASRTLWYSGR